MKIQINEVWNDEGRSEVLAVIETLNHPAVAVCNWIEENRPDLSLAKGLFSHGYHAKAVQS